MLFITALSENGSEGESDEEENEVLEESPCGRWRKLRSKVRRSSNCNITNQFSVKE